jgi:hypothetical protein
MGYHTATNAFDNFLVVNFEGIQSCVLYLGPLIFLWWEILWKCLDVLIFIYSGN